jgi:cytochrome c biogenesis factor
MAGIIALALTGVGTFLILVGVWVSLNDYKKKNAGLKAENFAGGNLEGLAKLAEALKTYPLGMQLIFVGVALMLAGGTVGGVSSL